MIERTKNYRRIKGLAPKWDLVVSDKVYYLVEVKNGEDVGAVCFHPCEKDGLMVHIVFSKQHRGKLASKSIKAAFQWLFDNTKHDNIVALIPTDFRRVHFLARNVGMNSDGIEENLFRCYSISKHDFKQRVA